MDTTQPREQLDPSIIALTKAIGHQESGGEYNKIGDNGHSKGAYQWNNPTPLKEGEIPKNFSGFAHDVGADPNDFSPANQDRVAYKTVEMWGKQGLNPAQIASKWNSGNPDAYKTARPGYNAEQGVNYDVKGYVDNVAKYYQEYQGGQSQPTSSTEKNTDGYITSANIPQEPNADLKAGTPGLLARATGGGKLAQGLGYTASNVLGTQKQAGASEDQAIQVQANIVKAIEDARKNGQDTTHLMDLLKQQTANINNIGGKVGDIGTGGISNGDVIKSAVGLAGTIATAPSLIEGGIGLLKGGASALESPAVETAMKEFNMPMEEFKSLSNAEKLNALTEASKTATTTNKLVIQQAIDEITPAAIKEAGGKVAFAKLYPKVAKVLGLLKSGGGYLGAAALGSALGGSAKNAVGKVTGLIK